MQVLLKPKKKASVASLKALPPSHEEYWKMLGPRALKEPAKVEHDVDPTQIPLREDEYSEGDLGDLALEDEFIAIEGEDIAENGAREAIEYAPTTEFVLNKEVDPTEVQAAIVIQSYWKRRKAKAQAREAAVDPIRSLQYRMRSSSKPALYPK